MSKFTYQQRQSKDDWNKEIRLEFSDGSARSYQLKAENGVQTFTLSQPVTTMFVKIVVVSHYSKLNNGAAAIEFFGCVTIPIGIYTTTYTNGATSTTTVSCDGTMFQNQYPEHQETGGFAGWTKAGTTAGTRNNDPNYKAEDGWYYRPWTKAGLGRTWEYYRFKDGNILEIHHFNAGKTGTSPLGSANFEARDQSTIKKGIHCGGL